MSQMANLDFVQYKDSPYVLATVIVLLSIIIMSFFGFGKSTYNPRGKHCYITGGSSGLGKALAESLVKQGAHVTIVARDVAKLQEAEKDLKALASPGQIIQSFSADLTSATASSETLSCAFVAHGGQAPEYTFLSAGFSRPKFFVDNTAEELKAGLDGVYWVSAYTAHAVCTSLVKQRRKGKIVFVSSFLGYTSFAGYTPYSPGKYALRGLADALRSEMLLHDIDVHIFMPCGIAGPGYEAEETTKPAITRKIEEGDTVQPPQYVAMQLENGLRKGYYQITDNLVTDFARLRSNGGVPSNNFFADCFYLFISSFGLPIWRMTADASVRKAKQSVKAEYEQKGFYNPPSFSDSNSGL